MSRGTMQVTLIEATVIALARRAREGETIAGVIARLAKDEPAPAPTTSPKGVVPPAEATPRSRSEPYTLLVLGDRFPCESLADCLAAALGRLAELDGDLLERLSRRGGRTRPHVGRSREGLHPGRPELDRQYAREITPGSGWWVSTNRGREDVDRVLREACDLLGLRFGEDVRIEG